MNDQVGLGWISYTIIGLTCCSSSCMVQEVSITRLRQRRAMRIGKVFGLVQSVVILLLLVWVSEEYDHNQFFQAWAEARFGGLAFFLNGTLAAFYSGLVIAYYLSLPLGKRESLVVETNEVLAEAQATT